MDKLPKELLSDIGTQLSYKDRVSCTSACKAFNVIHADDVNHKFTLKNENVSARLARLSKTIAYIQQIKPHLKVLDIDIDSVTDPSMVNAQKEELCLASAFFTTNLHFKNCTESVINNTLDFFANWPSLRLLITADDGLTGEEKYLKDNSPFVIASISVVLSTKNIGRDLGVLKNRRFCASPKLYLVTHFDFRFRFEGHVVIDLSHIDVAANTLLAVMNGNFKQSTMHYVDAWKITHFIDKHRFYERSVKDNQGLATSLAQEPEKIRMESISIECEPYAQHDVLMEMAKTIPKHVELRVAVRTPLDLWHFEELAKVKVANLKYFCCDRQTHLAAMLIKQVYSGAKFDLDLYIGAYDGYNDDIKALGSVNDIYGEMCDYTKSHWFGIWKIASDK